MAIYGYTWEAFEFTTRDGYTNTMMHVTGKIGEEPEPRTLGPIMVQHPMGTSPEFWIMGYAAQPTKNALLLDLFDEGYDLWFPYNRGTEYSQ